MTLLWVLRQQIYLKGFKWLKQTQGTIRPNLWNAKPPQRKKKKRSSAEPPNPPPKG